MGRETPASPTARVSPPPSTWRIRSVYAQTHSPSTPLHGTMASFRSSDPLVVRHGRCARLRVVSGKVQVHEGVPGEVDARGAGALARVAVQGQGGGSDADPCSYFAE